MLKRSYLFALVPMLLHVGIASAQESYPIMEKIAQRVIAKYQSSSCRERAQMEQRAVQVLRNDPQMRTAFINKVAAPIANKLFECGMIP